MTSTFYKAFLGTWVCYALLSCDRPTCQNENPIFDQYTVYDPVYQEELIQEIKGQSLRYWLAMYEEKDGHEFILVRIQNEKICARGRIKVEDWTGMEGIKHAEGKGYIGAELLGLRYQILSDNTLLFTGLDRIID